MGCAVQLRVHGCTDVQKQHGDFLSGTAPKFIVTGLTACLGALRGMQASWRAIDARSHTTPSSSEYRTTFRGPVAFVAGGMRASQHESPVLHLCRLHGEYDFRPHLHREYADLG